jgi:hypothetical protein
MEVRDGKGWEGEGRVREGRAREGREGRKGKGRVRDMETEAEMRGALKMVSTPNSTAVRGGMKREGKRRRLREEGGEGRRKEEGERRKEEGGRRKEKGGG